MLTDYDPMAKKITRTWKIEEDIAGELDQFSQRTHVPLGDSVQLGIWITIHIRPDERDAMLALMDARKPILIRSVITSEPKGGDPIPTPAPVEQFDKGLGEDLDRARRQPGDSARSHRGKAKAG